MKKLVAFLLSAAMLVSVCALTLTASAETNYGDVDGNGTVDATDALMVLQSAVSKITLGETQADQAEVSADGNIDASDALLILQYAVNKIDTFPRDSQTPVKPDPPVANETILDTGSYTVDTSADNSFNLDVSNLASNAIYVMSEPSTAAEQHLVYAFQGLFNRQFMLGDEATKTYDTTHTSLFYVAADGSDTQWLRYCKESGIMKDLENIRIYDMNNFYETFKSQLIQCGMTLWDDNVPATMNVATTVCSCDGYLPVRTGSEVYTKMIELGAEVKLDLNGKFTGTGTIWGTDLPSTGSTKNDAYRFALEKYMDRCSAYYVGYTLDGAVHVASNPCSQLGYSQFNCLKNTDYLVARHAFVFDLQPNIEEVCDDRTQTLGTDHETFIMILQRRYERANGAFGRMMGFPPWWVKYTVDTPGDGNHNGVLGGPQLEWLCCQYITSYNMAMEADAAHPCSMTNGSFYTKYRVTNESFTNNEPTEQVTFDSSKHYFLFYVGDYDSSAWMKFYLSQFWKDNNRGTIPLMWSFNPNLSYRIPMIFQYVYDNASPNDYFVTAEGAGYIMPGQLIENLEQTRLGEDGTRDVADGLDRWAEFSKPYYELFDMDITGFIINATSGTPATKGINADIMRTYNKFTSVGAFHNAGSSSKTSLALYDGTPYVFLYNEVAFDVAPDTYFGQMYGSYDQGAMRRFNFSAYRTVVQSPSTLKTLSEDYAAYASAQSGKDYVFVDPYNFFSLIRQSGQGTEFDEEYVAD